MKALLSVCFCLSACAAEPEIVLSVPPAAYGPAEAEVRVGIPEGVRGKCKLFWVLSHNQTVVAKGSHEEKAAAPGQELTIQVALPEVRAVLALRLDVRLEAPDGTVARADRIVQLFPREWGRELVWGLQDKGLAILGSREEGKRLAALGYEATVLASEVGLACFKGAVLIVSPEEANGGLDLFARVQARVHDGMGVLVLGAKQFRFPGLLPESLTLGEAPGEAVGFGDFMSPWLEGLPAAVRTTWSWAPGRLYTLPHGGAFHVALRARSGKPLAAALEIQHGKGRIMACAANLVTAARQDPGARMLLHEMLERLAQAAPEAGRLVCWARPESTAARYWQELGAALYAQAFHFESRDWVIACPQSWTEEEWGSREEERAALVRWVREGGNLFCAEMAPSRAEFLNAFGLAGVACLAQPALEPLPAGTGGAGLAGLLRSDLESLLRRGTGDLYKLGVLGPDGKACAWHLEAHVGEGRLVVCQLPFSHSLVPKSRIVASQVLTNLGAQVIVKAGPAGASSRGEAR